MIICQSSISFLGYRGLPIDDLLPVSENFAKVK
jgi:hypothetical protein